MPLFHLVSMVVPFSSVRKLSKNISLEVAIFYLRAVPELDRIPRSAIKSDFTSAVSYFRSNFVVIKFVGSFVNL